MQNIVYKSNFLTNVIFRLDVASLIFLDKENLSKIQTEIIDYFSTYELIKRSESTFQMGNIPETIVNREINIHVFRDKENTIKLDLSESSIIVEVIKYKNFDEFYKIVSKVLTSVFKYLPNIIFSRIGLRYINLINIDEGNPLVWKEFINTSLTYNIDNFFKNKEYLSRAISQVIYSFEDYALLFTYGLPNGSFPAPINRREFVLDFDCYTSDFNGLEIETILKKFNHKIKENFENSITEELRLKMGKK